MIPALRYTASAENDLLDAWLFIAEDNPDAADRVVDTINQEAIQLLAHPEIGAIRPELAKGIRIWPTTSKPYLIFYFSDATGIIVTRVLPSPAPENGTFIGKN